MNLPWRTLLATYPGRSTHGNRAHMERISVAICPNNFYSFWGGKTIYFLQPLYLANITDLRNTSQVYNVVGSMLSVLLFGQGLPNNYSPPPTPPAQSTISDHPNNHLCVYSILVFPSFPCQSKDNKPQLLFWICSFIRIEYKPCPRDFELQLFWVFFFWCRCRIYYECSFPTGPEEISISATSETCITTWFQH